MSLGHCMIIVLLVQDPTPGVWHTDLEMVPEHAATSNDLLNPP